MLKIEFETENAAFHDNLTGECARILRALADRLDAFGDASDNGLLRDSNGNLVGTWRIGDED